MEETLEHRFKKVQPAVIGVFKDHDHLKETLKELQDKNFSNEEISIMKAKSSELYDFHLDQDLMAGAYTGAFIGVIIGAAMCALASFRLIVIPGSDTFIEVGPFLSAVAGASIGINAGAVAGIITGYLIAKIEHRGVEKYLEKRGVVVSVHADGAKAELTAKKILVSHGAVKIFNPVYN